MKTPLFAIALFLAALLLHGCTNQAQPALERVVVDIQTMSTAHLSGLGRYERFVALESVDEALLGSIDAVKLSAEGHFLVGDFRASLKIYRFDENGRFLTAYGNKGEGPGEWAYLSGFEIFPGGQILAVSPRKLSLFDPDGSFLKQVHLPYFADESHRLGEHIYLRTAPTGRNRLSREIVVFDRHLAEVTSMHPFDRRIQILSYLPVNSMAATHHGLYVAERFDFGLTLYDLEHRPQAYFPFPNQNQANGDRWQVKPKTDWDLQQMVMGLHRTHAIYAFDEGLFVLEIHGQRRIFRANLLDPAQQVMFRFDELPLFRTENDAFLPPGKIVGAYERGIIGVLDNPELFERHRSNYPGLDKLSYSIESNPILLFLDLNMPSKDGKKEPAS